MAGPEEYTQLISCKLLTMRQQLCILFFLIKKEIQCLLQNVFQPVGGHEEALTDSGRICTHLMSISEMPVFQNLSHEV